MNLTNFNKELKKNTIETNILFILILLYPISLVIGPALIEITIFLSLIVSFFIFKKANLKNFFLKFNYKFILIFFCITIISSLLSDNIIISLKSSFFSIRFFIFFIIFTLLINKLDKFNEIFFKTSFVFIVICIFDGYLNLFFNINIFFNEMKLDGPITGLFFEEKKLGRYLVTLSPILAGLYLINKNENIHFKIIKVFIFLNIVFLLVLYTSERVSMFYASFTIFCIIMLGLKYSKKYLFFFLVPIIIVIFLNEFKIKHFNTQIKDSINQITNNKKEFSYPSKQHRAFIYTSYKLFTQSPLFGIGANNYRNSCKQIKYDSVKNCSTHPHNIFFQILAETGILGTIIYIYFLLVIIIKLMSFVIIKNNLNTNIFFLLPVFYFFNPFFPSGNFFNNWFMAIGTFGIPFYLYFNEKKFKFHKQFI